MDCAECRERLNLSVDGELTAAGEAAVREHLVGCPACAGRKAFLMRLKAATREAGGAAGIPAGFRERLQARLAEPAPAAPAPAPVARLRPRWVRPALAAAGVALLMGGSLLLLQPGPQPVVRALAADHLHCWEIPASRASSGSFRVWAEKHPAPPAHLSFLPPGAVAYDQRACVGEEVDGNAPHVMLQHGPGKAHLSLYALPAADMPGVEEERRPFRAGDVHVVAWREGDWVYAAVSEMPQDDLLRVAAAF